MLGSWRKRAFQIIVLILLLTQISVTRVLAQELQSANTDNSSSANIENINLRERTPATPVMEDNRRVTPNNERQVTPQARSSRTNSSRPNDPYEKYYDAIKKFNDELYGERG